MPFIKLPQGTEPGFYVVFNTDFVSHVETTTGEEGGHIKFFSAGKEPFTYTYDAPSKAHADKHMDEVLRTLFSPKDITAPPYKGLLS